MMHLGVTISVRNADRLAARRRCNTIYVRAVRHLQRTQLCCAPWSTRSTIMTFCTVLPGHLIKRVRHLYTEYSMATRSMLFCSCLEQ